MMLIDILIFYLFIIFFHHGSPRLAFGISSTHDTTTVFLCIPHQTRIRIAFHEYTFLIDWHLTLRDLCRSPPWNESPPPPVCRYTTTMTSTPQTATCNLISLPPSTRCTSTALIFLLTVTKFWTTIWLSLSAINYAARRSRPAKPSPANPSPANPAPAWLSLTIKSSAASSA